MHRRLCRADPRDREGRQGDVKQEFQEADSSQAEVFLSGAYQRILKITAVLGVSAVVGGTAWMGWRSGLILLIGSAVGYANFVWLHRAATIMVDRVVQPERQPSKLRLLWAFAGRYIFVILVSYVIFRGYPRMVIGFMVTLVLPVIAAVCEGGYELFVQSAGK